MKQKEIYRHNLRILCEKAINSDKKLIKNNNERHFLDKCFPVKNCILSQESFFEKNASQIHIHIKKLIRMTPQKI